MRIFIRYTSLFHRKEIAGQTGESTPTTPMRRDVNCRAVSYLGRRTRAVKNAIMIPLKIGNYDTFEIQEQLGKSNPDKSQMYHMHWTNMFVHITMHYKTLRHPLNVK